MGIVIIKPKNNGIVETPNRMPISKKNKKPPNRFFFTALRLIDTASPNFRSLMIIRAGANQLNARETTLKIVITTSASIIEERLSRLCPLM